MKTASISETAFASRHIRKRGIGTFLLGSVVYAAIVYQMGALSPDGYFLAAAFIPAGIASVAVAVGFVELVSGTPYYQLIRNWEKLDARQRVMIGIFLTVTFIIVVLCIFALLVPILI